MTGKNNTGSNWSFGAAVGAAVAASTCCTIPLALVSLGIGGAWIGNLTALEPYRWIFVALAVGALGYAGYNEWRLSRRPACDCETIFSSMTRRVMLGVGTLAVLGLIASPWLIAGSAGAATERANLAAQVAADSTEEMAEEQVDGQHADAPESFQQVVLEVEGMTCAACPLTVEKALARLDGVYSTRTSYEPPEAVVRFDPAKITIEDLTRTTADAGYPSQPKPSS